MKVQRDREEKGSKGLVGVKHVFPSFESSLENGTVPYVSGQGWRIHR